MNDACWSLANAAGASSSGSVSGVRRSPGQALLATKDFVLVNGMEAWVGHAAGRSSLVAQRYLPGVTTPDESRRIVSFADKPWPTWRFKVDGGAHVTQEIQLVPGHALVALRWSLVEDLPGFAMHVRPFLSGRRPEALHRKNDRFRALSEKRGWRVAWRPYEGIPEINAYSGGAFVSEPHWYENFLYDGGATEDLFAPGVFHGPLRYGAPFEVILSAGWDEVVEGMILPEHPVLWAEGEAKPRRVKPEGKTAKKTSATKKPGTRAGKMPGGTQARKRSR